MSAKLTVDDDLDLPLDTKVFNYPSLVGKLLYVSNCTRPDITVSVNHLSRYMSAPTARHWEQAKRILRYLKGTAEFCITFSGDISSDLLMWQDSSYGDGDNRRSRTGFVAMVCGGTVAWGSKLQSTVALSTTEAEYMALAAAAQEVLFLRQLLSDFGFTQSHPTLMFEDNKSCISLATNPMTTAKTKHIDIRYHFVRDLATTKQINI